MSIVGTRPPLISETNLYELHHRVRLAIKPGMAIKSLEINSKEIHLMKPVTSADYSGKTVLTNSS